MSILSYILAAVQHLLPQAKFLHVVEDIKTLAIDKNYTANDGLKQECLEWIGILIPGNQMHLILTAA